jgi:serine/threonine protein kinase
MHRRATGKPAPDRVIIATYPELMPELADELRALALIERARHLARHASSSTDARDARAPLWEVGDVIVGTYEVQAVLGEGGMGMVWRCHHRRWDVDMAVKVPRPARKGASDGFLRECELWINLASHPHVVGCYYVRSFGDVPHIFMEHVSGGSLQAWIRENRLTDLSQRLDVAIQIAWGLEHAHEQGLIHHDVKPANVLMTPSGTAKVTDFGLARTLATRDDTSSNDPHQPASKSEGGLTPAYCSPEQADGRPVSRRTDIWGWSITILEMFTGAVTWAAGPQAPEALSRLRESSFDDGRPRIPADVADLIEHGLARDPEDRPEDLSAVIATLRELYQAHTGQAYARPDPTTTTATVSFLDLGKKTEADRLLADALGGSPHHPEATYNRALLAWRADRIDDEALIDTLQSLRRVIPESFQAHTGLGLVYLERGEPQRAEEAFNEALRRAPGERRVRQMLEAARSSPDRWNRCLRVLNGHAGPVRHTCLSGDARFALTGGADDKLVLWDLEPGRQVRVFRGQFGPVNALSLSHDARIALSAGTDGALMVWDVDTTRCVESVPDTGGPVHAASLDGSGEVALTAGSDGVLKIWYIRSGVCVGWLEGHAAAVSSVVLTADAQCAVSGGADATVRVWDVSARACLAELVGHTDRVQSVACNDDASKVVSVGDDRTVRLWSTSTGRCVATMAGHTASVGAVAISGDGRFVLSGGDDAVVKLWDATTGRCLRTLRGHVGPVNSVAISRDGRTSVSGGEDTTVKLWKTGPLFAAPLMLCRAGESKKA